MNKVAMICEWHIRQIENLTGELIYEDHGHNVITTAGAGQALFQLFDGSQPLVALCGGACSTAATISDTHLNYEHIANASRKTLTVTSVVNDTYLDPITGLTFHKKITATGTFDGSTDSNVNQPFQEYGLNTSTTLPGSPTGTSGVLFNHYVAATPTILTGSPSPTTIILDTVIRA